MSLPLPHQTAKKARWSLPQSPQPLDIDALVRKHNLPSLIVQILLARDIQGDFFSDFLTPTLKSFLPDPSHLLDMDKAVNTTADQIERGQKIGIFGDYDVDGATSTSLLIRYFRQIKHACTFHIPDRIEEGYGLNIHGLEKLKENGCNFVITVDCGTLSVDPIAYAKTISQTIIVLDHHKGGSARPDCIALVNPNQTGEGSPLTYLCAAGLVFLFLVGLNRELRQRNYFHKENLSEPNLMDFLDLVALGTVCDVVPLKGLNRAYVRQGLKVLSQRNCLGLNALAEVSGLKEDFTPYHLGFVLGPRINAGGRIDQADMGVRLLTTSDPAEAQMIANHLDQANKERQSIERDAVKEAITQLEDQPEQKNSPILLCQGKDWHPGIVGLIASRVKEHFHKPAVALTFYEDPHIAKGSARSISGYDIGEAFVEASSQDLLLKGGGHPMAGGLSVAKEKIYDFQQFLLSRAQNLDTTRHYHLVARLPLSALSHEFYEALEALQPFGMGNPTPKFLFPDVILSSCHIFGKGHMKAWIQDFAGTGIEVLAFGAEDTPLGIFLKEHLRKSVHVIGTVNCSTWGGGKSLQIIIDDIALSPQSHQTA